MRCKLTLAYNGTHFLGSQIQKSSSNTIMGTLTHILIKLNIHSKVIASGRTDKGVHATAQVCHIDLPEFWSDLPKLHRVLNEMLPPSIRVKHLKKADENFHARYDAKKRIYRYLLKESPIDPFQNDFITFVDSLNFLTIKKNIQLFEGVHDFKYFMKTGSETENTTRVVYKAFAYRYKDVTILHFEANGFLRSQIRLMVGALLKLNAQELQEQISSQKNYKIKPAKSNGLYLSKIKY